MGRTVLSSVLVGPARRLITAWCISRHASAPPTTHTTLTSRGGAASISCISVYHVTPHTSHRQQRTRHSLLLLPMPASPHRTAAFERSSAGTLNAASGSCGAKQRAQPPNKRRPKRRPSRSTRAPSPWSRWPKRGVDWAGVPTRRAASQEAESWSSSAVAATRSGRTTPTALGAAVGTHPSPEAASGTRAAAVGCWAADGVEGGLRRAGAEAPGLAMVLGAGAGVAAAPRRGCRGGSSGRGGALRVRGVEPKAGLANSSRALAGHGVGVCSGSWDQSVAQDVDSAHPDSPQQLPAR